MAALIEFIVNLVSVFFADDQRINFMIFMPIIRPCYIHNPEHATCMLWAYGYYYTNTLMLLNKNEQYSKGRVII